MPFNVKFPAVPIKAPGKERRRPLPPGRQKPQPVTIVIIFNAPFFLLLWPKIFPLGSGYAAHKTIMAYAVAPPKGKRFLRNSPKSLIWQQIKFTHRTGKLSVIGFLVYYPYGNTHIPGRYLCSTVFSHSIKLNDSLILLVFSLVLV